MTHKIITIEDFMKCLTQEMNSLSGRQLEFFFDPGSDFKYPHICPIVDGQPKIESVICVVEAISSLGFPWRNWKSSIYIPDGEKLDWQFFLLNDLIVRWTMFQKLSDDDKFNADPLDEEYFFFELAVHILRIIHPISPLSILLSEEKNVGD